VPDSAAHLRAEPLPPSHGEPCPRSVIISAEAVRENSKKIMEAVAPIAIPSLPWSGRPIAHAGAGEDQP